MAAKLKPYPRKLPFLFPAQPSSPQGSVQWIRDWTVQFQQFLTRLELEFESFGEGPTIPGGGGGGGGGGSIPSSVWFTHWHFPYVESGMVLRGRTNDTRWRLTVNDADAQFGGPNEGNPRYVLVNGATEVHGDMRFGSQFAGPIIQGRHRSQWYRFLVDDADPANPRLRFEAIAQYQITTADFQFAVPGFTWVNRGTVNGLRWEWTVANEGGDLAADARLRLMRFDA